MTRSDALPTGFGPIIMYETADRYETADMYETADLMPTKVAIVAALRREVKPLIKRWTAVQRQYSGRHYEFLRAITWYSCAQA